MARRSARLKKQSPAPADTSMRSSDSWHTASSPGLDLPSLPELPDPNMKTPQKSMVRPVSKLPQATSTPLKTQPSKSQIATAASHTPKDRTPIKPAGQEMHPALHHASTAKVLDEARWLGFQALGAYTAPPKAVGAGQQTPSKTPVPTSANNATQLQSSPDFRFRFKSPFALMKGTKDDEAGLSPASRRVLKDAAISGTPGAGSRALFGTTEFSTKADMSPQRKKVEAKGKMARFSDVHMQQFKKMDSIANHASAFRADPGRFKAIVGQPLKKSPSKPDLAKPETNQLKRTQSKMDVNESASKIPPTPLKRTQSKMDMTGSGLPRSQSTVRLVPPTSESGPASHDGASNPIAKRVKRTESDDAATTRPASSEEKLEPTAPVVAKPARKITSQTALPRLAARLMTPTKSSIARSQSVKVTRTTSMIPSLLKSPSTNALKTASTSNIFFPAQIAQTMRDGARESMRKANSNLQRVRSILRTPSRKFSDDPAKIAAGTHMSPPPVLTFEKALPRIPATAPVKKHVNFSNSTLERAASAEIVQLPPHSPSPTKFRAASEVAEGAVAYPSLQSSVPYPDLSQDDETPVASPSRRLTFGAEVANHARQFSFESGKPVDFGPASAGTIRMVRKSDAASLFDGKKRKLETLQESSDKENDTPAEDGMRSAKKMKSTPSAPPKAMSSPSKVPRRTPGRGSSISKSRLAFLATPRRGKA